MNTQAAWWSRNIYQEDVTGILVKDDGGSKEVGPCGTDFEGREE